MLEVEHNTVVYPPNKCLERKIELSTTPVVYDHLLFLDFNGKGESILGSSNLNGTVWEGTLLFFNNEENLQLLKYNRSLIGSTISDGKFLKDNTVSVMKKIEQNINSSSVCVSRGHRCFKHSLFVARKRGDRICRLL
jgi:hypothetical protein